MIKCATYWSMRDGLANTHPIDDALDQAKAAGFAGIELCIGPGPAPADPLRSGLTSETMEADCVAVRARLDATGLHCSTIASGMTWAFNPTSDDPAVRERAIELHAAALQRAAWLGCGAMLYVPGVVNSPIAPEEHVRYDTAVDRARDGVSRLLETAERVGVDLCLENVWNGLFYSPLELRDFIDSFGSDRLGVYFDVGNVLGYQQRPEHWIELLSGRIKRVHIKGYRESFGFDGSYAFCGLMEGDVPWAATMAALRAIGYEKTLVAEMMPWSEGLLDQVSRDMDAILAA